MAVDIGIRIDAKNMSKKQFSELEGDLRSVGQATDAVSRKADGAGKEVRGLGQSAEAAGNRVVTFDAKTGRARNELGRFVKMTDRAGDELGRFGQRADGAGRQAAGFGHRVETARGSMLSLMFSGGAATAFFGTMTRGFIESGIAAENYHNALDAVFGADIAEERYRQIVALSELPGISFEGAVQGAIRLQNMNIEIGLADRLIRELGNAMALVGNRDLPGALIGVEQLTSGMGDLNKVAKLNQEDLNQIRERAPGFAKALVQAYGSIKTDVINKQLEAAGTTGLQFFDDILGRMERMARVSEDATSNVISNFQNASFHLKAALGEAILPTLNSVILTVTDLIEGFNALGDTEKSIVAWAVAGTTAISGLLTVLGAVGVAVPALISGLAAMGLTGAALAPVGIGVGAVAAIGGGLYLLTRQKDELKEKEKELTEAYNDKVRAIEASADALTDEQKAEQLASASRERSIGLLETEIRLLKERRETETLGLPELVGRTVTADVTQELSQKQAELNILKKEGLAVTEATEQSLTKQFNTTVDQLSVLELSLKNQRLALQTLVESLRSDYASMTGMSPEEVSRAIENAHSRYDMSETDFLFRFVTDQQESSALEQILTEIKRLEAEIADLQTKQVTLTKERAGVLREMQVREEYTAQLLKEQVDAESNVVDQKKAAAAAAERAKEALREEMRYQGLLSEGVLTRMKAIAAERAAAAERAKETLREELAILKEISDVEIQRLQLYDVHRRSPQQITFPESLLKPRQFDLSGDLSRGHARRFGDPTRADVFEPLPTMEIPRVAQGYGYRHPDPENPVLVYLEGIHGYLADDGKEGTGRDAETVQRALLEKRYANMRGNVVPQHFPIPTQPFDFLGEFDARTPETDPKKIKPPQGVQDFGNLVGAVPGDIFNAFLQSVDIQAAAEADLLVLAEQTAREKTRIYEDQTLSAQQQADALVNVEAKAAERRIDIERRVASEKRRAFDSVVTNFLSGIIRMIAAEVQLQIAKKVTAALGFGSAASGAGAAAFGPAGLAVAGIAGLAYLAHDSGVGKNIGTDVKRLTSFSLDDPENDKYAVMSGRASAHSFAQVIEQNKAVALGRNTARHTVDFFKDGWDAEATTLMQKASQRENKAQGTENVGSAARPLHVTIELGGDRIGQKLLHLIEEAKAQNM